MEVSRSGERDWYATARTLSEALPFLQRYDGSTVVVKVGGHAMGDDEAMRLFARDIVLMKQCGVNPVVVHGGGPQIDAMLTRLGVQSEWSGGLRVTTAETIEIVEMVLAGSINKRIVAAINGEGGRGVGLSGKDGRLMTCAKALHPARGSEEGGAFDLGYVGEPTHIDPTMLQRVIGSDLIPVVAPIGGGIDPNDTYNVNADTAAGAIAAAMRAERLLLLTDTSGVKDAAGQVLTQMTRADIERLTADGTIAGGMIPKTQTAIRAVEAGVTAAVILDGRAEHAVLLELFTEHGAGTLIAG